MSHQTCIDCGSKVYRGHCTNCHEEIFIAQQYRDIGEVVPKNISNLELEQSIDETNFKEKRNE